MWTRTHLTLITVVADVLSNITHRIRSRVCPACSPTAGQRLAGQAALVRTHDLYADVLAVSLHVCRSDVIQAYCDYGLHAKNVRTQHIRVTVFSPVQKHAPATHKLVEETEGVLFVW